MTSAWKYVLVLAVALVARPGWAQCVPVHLTAQQAHQRMMDLLHITSIRPGYSGNAKGPNPANYDEAQ